MKKNLRGFTLIELIVVMAIFTILMTAIMQMFKPVRETYVDSTLYESQRTTQNGIVTYISESVRYATDLGMYTKGKSASGTTASGTWNQTVNSPDDAVKAFIKGFEAKHSIDADVDTYTYTDASGTPQTKTYEQYITANAEVIVINQEDTFTFNSVSCKGRLQRKKADGTFRVAMGEAYYGESSYTITLTTTTTPTTNGADDGISISVASDARKGAKDLFTDKISVSNGNVICKNLTSQNYGVSSPGMFDDSALACAGTTNTYIVWLDEKIA